MPTQSKSLLAKLPKTIRTNRTNGFVMHLYLLFVLKFDTRTRYTQLFQNYEFVGRHWHFVSQQGGGAQVIVDICHIFLSSLAFNIYNESSSSYLPSSQFENLVGTNLCLCDYTQILKIDKWNAYLLPISLRNTIEIVYYVSFFRLSIKNLPPKTILLPKPSIPVFMEQQQTIVLFFFIFLLYYKI